MSKRMRRASWELEARFAQKYGQRVYMKYADGLLDVRCGRRRGTFIWLFGSWERLD